MKKSVVVCILLLVGLCIGLPKLISEHLEQDKASMTVKRVKNLLGFKYQEELIYAPATFSEKIAQWSKYISITFPNSLKIGQIAAIRSGSKIVVFRLDACTRYSLSIAIWDFQKQAWIGSHSEAFFDSGPIPIYWACLAVDEIVLFSEPLINGKLRTDSYRVKYPLLLGDIKSATSLATNTFFLFPWEMK